MIGEGSEFVNPAEWQWPRDLFGPHAARQRGAVFRTRPRPARDLFGPHTARQRGALFRTSPRPTSRRSARAVLALGGAPRPGGRRAGPDLPGPAAIEPAPRSASAVRPAAAGPREYPAGDRPALRGDIRYRSISRPLVDQIATLGLPASVTVLRPPTFNALRDHLRKAPHHYHILHFDGHGAYGEALGHPHPHALRARRANWCSRTSRAARIRSRPRC